MQNKTDKGTLLVSKSLPVVNSDSVNRLFSTRKKKYYDSQYERECLSWLTQHPKTSAGITLRRLVCQISHIKTSNDKLCWIKQIREWHDEYEEFIKQKTINKETGKMTYTHDNVRRTYIHIKRALPNMFKYIDNPSIPNNTNSLESFFGHLKDNLRIHRGMSVEHRQNFIKWYLFFCNEKKKKDR